MLHLLAPPVVPGAVVEFAEKSQRFNSTKEIGEALAGPMVVVQNVGDDGATISSVGNGYSRGQIRLGRVGSHCI